MVIGKRFFLQSLILALCSSLFVSCSSTKEEKKTSVLTISFLTQTEAKACKEFFIDFYSNLYKDIADQLNITDLQADLEKRLAFV